MILTWMIIIPLAGALLAWLLGRLGDRWPRWVSLSALVLDIVLACSLWILRPGPEKFTGKEAWLAEFNVHWFTRLGIGFHLAADGISLVMIILTSFLGIAAVSSAWTEIRQRTGFFHFNLMLCLAGIVAVFLAVDLFLFYFFWEIMLVPMYFLIALWGHENRIYASVKFFIFTQVSGLFMLAAILGLYFVHGRNTGVYTFDYMQLLGTSIEPSIAILLMLGFVIAFFVKLPVVPFHTWLPDAHTEAPTAGSVVLAGLLLKTGAYGMLRFAVPLFPGASVSFTPAALVLGVIGIIYGAVVAFAQTDLKRLVAYTSVSHMGFVLLGIYAWNEVALQGAIMQMLCHGISTGALFILVGSLQERINTRSLDRMGGLWSTAPRMGGAGLFFALASLGLPGLGNFVGEFLILLGTYPVSPPMAAAAALGLVTSTIYSVWLVQRTFFGENTEKWKFPDLGKRETTVMAALIGVIVWLGIYPQPAITTAKHGVENLQALYRLGPEEPPGGTVYTADSVSHPGLYLETDHRRKRAMTFRRGRSENGR
ncbi:MAG: NADH-quinone oxidoreductase subunit M [Syntrophales bacterium]